MMTMSASVRSRHKVGRPLSWAKALYFIAPGYFSFVAFIIVPLILTVIFGFTSWDGFGPIKFNGLQNYFQMIHDPVFLEALLHNVVFLISSVVLKVAVALGLALMFRRTFPASGFFRGLFLVPTTLSLVVVAIVLQFVLDPNNGLINPVLRAIGLGALAGSWLGDPARALPIMIVLDVWVGFGLYMYLFLAGLSALPDDVFDAAKVDGANSWQETIHVTIPMLASTIKLVTLLGAIDGLKIFATIYLATGGGPNHATEVLSTWAFYQAFTGNNVGYGSAILVVLLIITFVLAFFYARQGRTQKLERTE